MRYWTIFPLPTFMNEWNRLNQWRHNWSSAANFYCPPYERIQYYYTDYSLEAWCKNVVMQSGNDISAFIILYLWPITCPLKLTTYRGVYSSYINKLKWLMYFRHIVNLVIFACLNFREFLILELFTKNKICKLSFFFSSAIIIIIFAVFLNSEICSPREICEN